MVCRQYSAAIFNVSTFLFLYYEQDSEFAYFNEVLWPFIFSRLIFSKDNRLIFIIDGSINYFLYNITDNQDRTIMIIFQKLLVTLLVYKN